MRAKLAGLLALIAAVGVNAQDAGEVTKPLEEQGYIGLTLRDIPSGDTVVSWIFPGPLKGEGLAAPAFDLARPDLIVSVDGVPLTAEQFTNYIRSKSPGKTVKIVYRRSNARGGTIPDQPNHEDQPRTIEVKLESRDAWMGTMRRGRGHDTEVTFEGWHMLEPFDPTNVLGKAIAQNDLREPLEKLVGVFADYQARDDDYHSLSRVRAAFENPFCLPELADLISAARDGLSEDPFELNRELTIENLDLDRSAPPLLDLDHPMIQGPLPSMSWDLSRLAAEMDAALGETEPTEAFALDCLELLRVPRRSFYIGGDDSLRHLSVIRSSLDFDFDRLACVFAILGDLAGTAEHLPDEMEVISTPVALRGAVSGEILGAAEDPNGKWIVIGSTGANSYDMARVVAVIDRAGDDAYYATDLRIGTRVIIDLAGNDHYTGTPDQGPGGALLGVSLIDDHAGDDVYEGELLACGAAMFGVSLLLDRDGNDIYRGSEWSIGAACYGAGIVKDLGNGNDQYLGDFLCQGVGGPRGFGAIIDENGRDLYRANGPTPSAYGTPAVYQSFSQGVGFGYRNYAAGGIGIISDLGGDDRYEAGEFAQGGAYYYGLGILHDAAGRDLYYGNRYGQGFGVHQAVGMLVDDAGDDTYWSMTAASQGAAWDIGVGMLLDRAGNDSYQCDGLGQGAASQQAIAYLIDLAGDDRYIARGGATQGQSGGNAYHYHETGAFSFSLLLDLGGGHDLYSRDRPNDGTTVTGSINEAAPKNSQLHGLVIDE